MLRDTGRSTGVLGKEVSANTKDNGGGTPLRNAGIWDITGTDSHSTDFLARGTEPIGGFCGQYIIEDDGFPFGVFGAPHTSRSVQIKMPLQLSCLKFYENVKFCRFTIQDSKSTRPSLKGSGISQRFSED